MLTYLEDLLAEEVRRGESGEPLGAHYWKSFAKALQTIAEIPKDNPDHIAILRCFSDWCHDERMKAAAGEEADDAVSWHRNQVQADLEAQRLKHQTEPRERYEDGRFS
jgi:hypothetical protein